MATQTYWKIARREDLSRSRFPGIKSQQSVRSTAIPVFSDLIRIRVDSGQALANPRWKLGAVIYWGLDFGAGFERFIQTQEINVPVNSTCLLQVPYQLTDPFIELEIPSWISDARATIWTISSDQLPQGETEVSIINPINLSSISVSTPPRANTASETVVESLTGKFTLLAANANRKGCMIKNSSTIKSLTLLFSASSDPQQCVVTLEPGGVYLDESNLYTGEIKGFMQDDQAGQNIRVTEFYYAA